ncbi:MAG: TIGR02996 domain-containing protein [Polyangiaceae bacterium]|nr:TIGR02996 domain-containing protein [Polyangiaceae bacterium]
MRSQRPKLFTEKLRPIARPRIARGIKPPSDAPRYERGTGSSLRYWQIVRRGSTVTTWFGRGDLPPRTISRRFSDAYAAKRAHRVLVALKRSQGYELDTARASPEPPRWKRGGVARRDPELEKAILLDPSDDGGFLVYADWLQSEGDPRGELAMVQHARSQNPASKQLKRAEETLLAEYADELLGPLAPYASDVTWRYGFVRSARVHRASAVPLDEVVRAALAHPAGRFIEDLGLGNTHFADDRPGYGPTLLALAEASPRTLHTLRVGDAHLVLGDVSNVFRILPHLRTVALSGSAMRLADRAPIFVTELVLSNVDLDSSAASSIAGTAWPYLETLSFRRSFSFGPYVDELFAKLQPSAMPALRRVCVRASHLRYGELAFDAALASPLLPQLTRLDLDLPFGADDVDKLLTSARSVAHVASIRLRAGNDIPIALREELATRLPNAVWSDFETDVPGAPPG